MGRPMAFRASERVVRRLAPLELEVLEDPRRCLFDLLSYPEPERRVLEIGPDDVCQRPRGILSRKVAHQTEQALLAFQNRRAPRG